MKITLPGIVHVVSLGLLWFAMTAAGADAAYSPLSTPAGPAPGILNFEVRDAARNRTIPIRIYLPRAQLSAPVILFSHGLGGTREGCVYLGMHWSARGYISVFLQHPGSDSSVWKDVPRLGRLSAMRRAANAQNFLLRVEDVSAVLDQLAEWNRADGHPLAGIFDLNKVGMSGHSFGALTTQAVSGQRVPGGNALYTDPRVRAALILSPSSPRQGTPQEAFGKVGLPWMLMTGTNDTAPIGNTDMKSRLAVYPALPPGAKYELILFEAAHSAFTDRSLPGDTGARNPNHHRVILALSTAFWDAYLRKDPAAKEWLDGDGPKSILEPRDTWRLK